MTKTDPEMITSQNVIFINREPENKEINNQGVMDDSRSNSTPMGVNSSRYGL